MQGKNFPRPQLPIAFQVDLGRYILGVELLRLFETFPCFRIKSTPLQFRTPVIERAGMVKIPNVSVAVSGSLARCVRFMNCFSNFEST